MSRRTIVMRIIDYLVLILTLIIVLGGIAYAAFKFFKMPKNEQYDKVKEWLKWACLQAEQVYGCKTGLIKLRYVYDLFVTRFPWLSQLITFEYFSSLVDEALKTVREQIETNIAVKNLVKGSEYNELKEGFINQ